jgi:hypothetical protein
MCQSTKCTDAMGFPLVIVSYRDPITILSLRLILSVGIMSTVPVDAERHKLAAMPALPGFSMGEEVSECSKRPKTNINSAKIPKKVP